MIRVSGAGEAAPPTETAESKMALNPATNYIVRFIYSKRATILIAPGGL